MKAITKQKTLREIEGLIEGESKVFLIGCGTCATMCRTGGKAEIEDMARRLADLGKTVVGSAVLPTVCDALDREALRENAKAIDEADCILVMACAFGVQTLALYTDKPVYPALETLFMGQEQDIRKAVGCNAAAKVGDAEMLGRVEGRHLNHLDRVQPQVHTDPVDQAPDAEPGGHEERQRHDSDRDRAAPQAKLVHDATTRRSHAAR